MLAEVLDVLPDLTQVPRELAMRAHRKSPAIHGGIRIREPICGETLEDANAVADEAKIPRGRYLRVLLTQRSRSGVARIGERRLPAQDK